MRSADDNISDGAQFAVQLARVTERRPRVAAIRSASSSLLHLAVKLRAHVVHYIVNGVVTCVIRALEPIADVCDATSSSSSDDARQLFVATASGAVWRVTLPARPLGALQHVLLQLVEETSVRATIDSSTTSIAATQAPVLGCALQDALDEPQSISIEWLGEVPGVRTVHACGNFIVCTSALAPTTLLWPSSSATELLALEAEQSTCAVTLCSSESDLALALVQWLASSHTSAIGSISAVSAKASAPLLLLLQGDMDGVVRYYVTSSSGADDDTALLPLTGSLVAINEPVEWLVPFTLRGRCGVLVVGSRGCASVVLSSSTNGGDRSNRSSAIAQASETLAFAFGARVQSIVFVAALECFVFSASGRAFAIRALDVISAAHGAASSLIAAFAAQLPIASGVVALEVHDDSGALSLAFASGRVVSMTASTVQRAVDSVLATAPSTRESSFGASESVSENAPAPLAKLADDADAATTHASRIKSLLQRIAHVSAASTALNTQSMQLDSHLRHLHAALVLQQQIAANGVHALLHCRLDLSLVATGDLARSKLLKLTCRIDANRLEMPDALLACWLVRIHVRSRSQLVTSFVFPLHDVLHVGPSPRTTAGSSAERSMLLSADTLEHADSGGVLFASCMLVFEPDTAVDQQHQQQSQSRPQQHIVNDSPAASLFAVTISLVHDRAFYLVQLSELLAANDVPTSVTAVKAAFRQDQDASLVRSNSSTSTHEQPQHSLLQGFELWSALAAHWHDKAFAALWMRDLQSASPELLAFQELQTLTEPTSPPQAATRMLEVAPPSRFTIVFPAFAVRELTVEHAVAVVRAVLGFSAAGAPQLLASCRSQSGKFWLGLRTFAANIVVLRLALADGTVLIDGEALQPLEVTVQCSSADDLSVMRALLLENVPRCSGHEEMAMPLDDVFAALSLQAAESRGLLDETASLAESVGEKIALNLRDLERCTLCTDEVVRLLADVARLETQTLDVYWQSRNVLNKFVI